MSPLVIENLGKAYGELAPALREVSLSIAEGETFGLIGVNGAGKTTLVRCLLDLVRFQHGTIRLWGRPHDLPEARRDLFYLPERFNPSRYLTAEEYLCITLDPYALRPSRQAMEEAAKEVEFPAEALGRRIASYSKGMTQKVGLMAALLADRAFYVFDEPMSGLDPHARRRVHAMFERFKTAKKTVLFTTHLLADINILCDRVGVVANNRLAFAGTLPALYAHTGTAGLDEAFLAITRMNA